MRHAQVSEHQGVAFPTDERRSVMRTPKAAPELAGQGRVDRSIGTRRAKRQQEYANDLADGILAGLRRSALARGEELNVDEAAWRKRIAAILGDAVCDVPEQGAVSSLSDRARGRR